MALEKQAQAKDSAAINNELDIEEFDEFAEDKQEEIVLSDNQFRVLKNHILNPLKRHLLKKDETEASKHSVRTEVAIGILQIIKLFPARLFNTELIGVISKVCSVLSDRDEDRRKSARTTLTQMQGLLGPFFLGFFVKELDFHLKRGYEAHIRNYMIFKLIETLVNPTDGR